MSTEKHGSSSSCGFHPCLPPSIEKVGIPSAKYVISILPSYALPTPLQSSPPALSSSALATSPTLAELPTFLPSSLPASLPLDPLDSSSSNLRKILRDAANCLEILLHAYVTIKNEKKVLSAQYEKLKKRVKIYKKR